MYDEYYRHDNSTPSNRYEALSDHEEDNDHDDAYEIDTNVFVPGISNDITTPPSATIVDNNINRYATRSKQRQHDHQPREHHNAQQRDQYPREHHITSTPDHSDPPINPKVIRELKKLDGFYNPAVHNVLQSLQPQTPTTINTLDTSATTSTETFDSTQATETNQPAIESSDNNNNPVPDTIAINNMMLETAMLAVAKQSSCLNTLMTMTTNGPNTLTIEQIKDQNNNPFHVPMSQLKDLLTVPNTYEEAYFNDNAWCRYRWRNAIKLELDKMIALL
jgi:hypothetical protein